MPAFNFNAATVEKDDDFDVIPEGDYDCIVTKTEIKRNRKDTGDVLTLTIRIMEGDYENRLVWHRINVTHENEKAQKIGQRELAELCNAIGVIELEDTDELMDKEFTARLKIEPGNGDWGPSNKVKKFMPYVS